MNYIIVKQNCMIVPDLMVPCLLGLDFIQKHCVTLDFEASELALKVVADKNEQIHDVILADL